MMRFEVLCLLVLAVAYASAQIAPAKKDDARLVVGTASFSFTTFTIQKYSSTTTSTLTSLTTCTTSTAALITCTPSMRRRRGLFYNNNQQDRVRRGLFYDEEDAEEKEGSVFLPASPVGKNSSVSVKEAPSKSTSKDVVIPLQIQSGVSVPSDIGNSRFLVSLGTKIFTSFVISTTTSSLTAICSSTTGFAVCSITGK